MTLVSALLVFLCSPITVQHMKGALSISQFWTVSTKFEMKLKLNSNSFHKSSNVIDK